MGRKFKNSDDCTYFSDRSIETRLEKLRMELIPNYAEKKYNKRKRNNNKPYKYNTPKNK